MPKRRSTCRSAPKKDARTGSTRVRAGLLLALLSALALADGDAAGQTPAPAPFVQRPETDLLLMAVRLQNEILADALPAYPARGGVLIPLGEVCRLLDLAIEVDVAHATVSGFFLTENRRFYLDVPGRRLVIDGKERTFDAVDVEVHLDDIYVNTQELGRWLPIDFSVDLSALLIVVRPEEPLPIQKKEAREALAGKALGSRSTAVPQFPRIENPYHLIDWPEIDQSVRFSLVPRAGGGHDALVQASTYASADLLYHEADAYFFVDSKGGISDSRLTLGRKDPDGKLLGFLGAREYAAGNVLYPGLDLISVPASGNGLALSNFPLDRQSQTDRNNFRGDLPPGWDVELYQNDALVAFQSSRPDGLYEFNNIPLLYGMNIFRLVFYGPQGQRREEIQRYNIADSMPSRGQLFYRLVGNNPNNGGERGHVELEYGLAKRLSALAGAAAVDLDNGWHRYGRFALRGIWGPVFAQADAVADIGNGSLFQGSAQGRFGPLGVFASYAKLQDFQSEIFRPIYGPIGSRGQLRFDAVVPKTFLPPISIVLEGRLDRITTGLDVWEFVNRISTGNRGFAVSNFLDWRTFDGPGAQPPNAFGDLLVSQAFRGFILRAEALYNLKPTQEVSSLGLTAELMVAERYQLQVGASRFFQAGQTRVFAGVSRLEGPVAFGVSFDYTQPGGVGVVMSVNSSFARDPQTGRWRIQGKALAGSGGISALTYLDANGNGRRDPGERPVEGVGFQTSSGSGSETTHADGVALLMNLPPYQNIDVGVETRTLEDLLERPSREGVRLVPRPGRILTVDFPIVIHGEVTGTVYLRRTGTTEPSSGVEIQIVDKAGAVVKKTRSAYDGFFDIPGLLPGRYVLRVSPEQMERLNFVAPPARDISMEPTGTILDGVDLVIDTPDAAHPR